MRDNEQNTQQLYLCICFKQIKQILRERKKSLNLFDWCEIGAPFHIDLNKINMWIGHFAVHFMLQCCFFSYFSAFVVSTSRIYYVLFQVKIVFFANIFNFFFSHAHVQPWPYFIAEIDKN